ncbi:DTW domain-containing protein [Pseudenhygromyxa sp. WMMC2535]|uniref:tRNA-uridine aminocarboxypropyltransferase n=1 Tax=Pseudenhygromyxa sp. WMMC2535 TaxID=2712867 RepID=UPI00155621A3|nr:tRNA-uridine aminocarboxypropyltransferase [Pseudenhygromyxa sp. WMMC2535]NVB39498.1 DTW domain-containing protein [Pseudenhygromyxa sp. WMMC2535]
MGQRRFVAERCPDCGLHAHLCACAERPQITLGTEIVVLQNNRERNKPTNTGRMIPQLLTHSQLVYYGARDEPWRGEVLARPGREVLLIFPRVDDPEGPNPRPAPSLDAASAASFAGKPLTLVLLDGTWAQCSRMSRRVPELAALPAWGLSEAPGSDGGHWGVRTASEPGRLSSFEAAIRLVELFEGPAPALRMQVYFDLIAARMLHMKAKLSAPEVPGAWIEARARRFGQA